MSPLSRRSAVVGGAAVLALVVSACASNGTPERARPAAPAAANQQSTLGVPAGMGAAPFDRPRTVSVPSGWHLSVFARVQTPRLATWTPDHRMLISRPEYGDVVVLTPRGAAAPSKRVMISGLRQPHGLAFRGSTLYVAESNRVDTFTYRSGTATGKRLLVGGLPDQQSPELGGAYAHALKSVVVRPDGTVYISVGSTGNISSEDRSASPQRATILRYRDGKLGVVARGVRNGTGLALDPAGNLWTAVNNRDQIAYPYPGSNYGKVIQSYVNDHPLEELAKLYGGRDLGWPYCNPEPDVAAGDYSERPFVHDAQTNEGWKNLDCRKLRRIEQGLPAHSAPLGLSFTTLSTYGTGALVGTHGSWNRTPPRAPTVTFFPWSNGTLGKSRVLVSGFQNSDGSRWGRPVAAVRSPASTSVYITDDQAGAVYRLTPG